MPCGSVKVVILDFVDAHVEVVDIPEEYIIYNIDGKMDGEDILAEMGYKLDNIQYMFVDGDVHLINNGKHLYL